MTKQYSYTIKELPAGERPREKLLEKGSKSLSNSEILALLLGSGSKGRTALELGQDLICRLGGVAQFLQVDAGDLMDVQGIGRAKAGRILAALELGKRIRMEEIRREKNFSTPGAAADFLIPQLGSLDQEVCMALLLNSQHQLISAPEISRGSLTRSILHPREVFKAAIRMSAFSVILAHNHPSGEVRPSEEDIELTGKMVEAGDIVGIPMLDHIIVGGNDYISLRQQEMIN